MTSNYKTSTENIRNATIEVIKWEEAYSMSNGDSCEFEGNDISSISSVESYTCALQFCRYNPECTHYTWTSENGGTCYLKTGPVVKSDAKSVDIYKKYPKTWMCGIDNTKKTFTETTTATITTTMASTTTMTTITSTTTTIKTYTTAATATTPRTSLSFLIGFKIKLNNLTVLIFSLG